MYPLAALIGIAQSIAVNTVINLIGEVVGLRGKTGATVYGFYGLCDKSANGITTYIIMVFLHSRIYATLFRIVVIWMRKTLCFRDL
jgi:hypothetical protein